MLVASVAHLTCQMQPPAALLGLLPANDGIFIGINYMGIHIFTRINYMTSYIFITLFLHGFPYWLKGSWELFGLLFLQIFQFLQFKFAWYSRSMPCNS